MRQVDTALHAGCRHHARQASGNCEDAMSIDPRQMPRKWLQNVASPAQGPTSVPKKMCMSAEEEQEEEEEELHELSEL